MLFARFGGVPSRKPEVRVLGSVLGAFQDFWSDVGLWEVGYRIPAWFEEEENVLTIGDPSSGEPYAHAPSQRLDVQKPQRQGLGHQEPADCSWGERTLLPGQSHRSPHEGFLLATEALEALREGAHHPRYRPPEVRGPDTRATRADKSKASQNASIRMQASACCSAVAPALQQEA